MAPEPPEGKEEKVRALDEDDIALLKSYGQGPYSARIKDIEKDVKDTVKKVNDVSGIKESDTGLAAPSRWDLVSDKQAMQEEQPLQVSCITQMPLSAVPYIAYCRCCHMQHRNVSATDRRQCWPWHLSGDICTCGDAFAGGLPAVLSSILYTGGQVHQDHQAWH